MRRYLVQINLGEVEGHIVTEEIDKVFDSINKKIVNNESFIIEDVNGKELKEVYNIHDFLDTSLTVTELCNSVRIEPLKGGNINVEKFISA